MESHIARYYHSDNLLQSIVLALEKAGKDPENLALKDLAPVDQLHTGGFLATLAVLKAADLPSGSHILDAGCGIGGSARLIAREFDIQVSAVDLSDEFILAARDLTRRCGLSGRVRYEQGSVLSLPFGDRTFDAVLSQHLLMNINDKFQAFREFARVLKPGGRLLLHEIFKQNSTPIAYPVPWASHEGLSFLDPWETTREQIISAGFTQTRTSDASEIAIEWWTKVKAAHSRHDLPPRPLGPHLVFGANGRLFGQTMLTNFRENRIRLIEAVFTAV